MGAVVSAAAGANLVQQVIVVDNGSSDSTAAEAAAHGAEVISAAERGKGQAMWAGVARADAEVIVFLDADLVGLSSAHVDSLVEPVLRAEVAMACGLFDRGPLQNALFLRTLPVLTGQRALHRSLLAHLDDDDIRGYRVEAALNSLVARRGLARLDRVLPGLWHRPKEEKLANPMTGQAAKVAMLSCACWSYLRAAATRTRQERVPLGR